jgi:hypothetical protein
LPQARHNQYTFDGYYSDAAMTKQATYTADVADTGDIVLYTKWTYIVEYNKNGGNGADIPSEVLVYNVEGSISAVPADWERGGYELLGWSTNANATEAMIPREGGAAVGLPANKVVRLYAVWRAGKSRVILSMGENAGGFAQSNPEVTALYGSALPELENVPERAGYVFAGYYDATEGGTLYYDSKGVSAHIWDKSAGTVTLYARWVYDFAGNLQGMIVSGGTLYPSFAANVFEYNLTLPCEEVTLALNYDKGNTVKVNDVPVQTSFVIDANPSYETLQIEVGATGKASKVYTIKLNAPLSSSNIEVLPGRMEVSDARYDSYQWYEDGVAIANATSAVLYPIGGFKAEAVYSVTAYSGYDSVRICGQTAASTDRSASSEKDAVLVASPNPASTHITVSHPDLGKETAVIKIYSTGGGSLVQSYTAESGSGSSVQVDISGLAAGSYLIEVLGVTTRIVKQ